MYKVKANVLTIECTFLDEMRRETHQISVFKRYD